MIVLHDAALGTSVWTAVSRVSGADLSQAHSCQRSLDCIPVLCTTRPGTVPGTGLRLRCLTWAEDYPARQVLTLMQSKMTSAEPGMWSFM